MRVLFELGWQYVEWVCVCVCPYLCRRSRVIESRKSKYTLNINKCHIIHKRKTTKVNIADRWAYRVTQYHCVVRATERANCLWCIKSQKQNLVCYDTRDGFHCIYSALRSVQFIHLYTHFHLMANTSFRIASLNRVYRLSHSPFHVFLFFCFLLCRSHQAWLWFDSSVPKN